MKKIIAILFLASNVFAFNPPNGAMTFSNDTRQVTLSTTSASPTQILTNDPNCTSTWLINTSTFTILISTISSNLSATTSAFIPGEGSTTGDPVSWSPDGSVTPYWGPLFAVEVTNGLAGTKLSVIRTK